MPRLIRHHPGYVAFAAATVALCGGAVVAVFSVVNAVWLRPLAFPQSDRLVILMGENTNAGSSESASFGGLERPAGWEAFEAVAGQVVTAGRFAGLTPYVTFEQVGREIGAVGVTSQYFRLLGQPIHGRDFRRDDNRAGAEAVAIISDRLWSRAFGRRPDAIGALAAAKPFAIRIIGVAPPTFEGARRGDRADIWIPSNLVPRVAVGAPAIPEDETPVIVFARLRPGQSADDAKRRLLRDAGDARDRRYKESLQFVPLKRVFGTSNSRTILIREGHAGIAVAALVSLVLLAGCTTLMAIVLVHYERRRHELSVRVALGASRGRLAAELAGELAWVALAGTAGGLLLAAWCLRSLPALSLPGGVDLSRLDLSIDRRVLLAAVSTTVFTLVTAALVPIAHFTRATLATELIALNFSASASSQRLRQSLLAIHVSSTIVILIAAGLFIRAVIHGFSAGPGFDVDRTVYLEVQVASPWIGAGTDDVARMAMIAQATRQLEAGLRALPGVEGVAIGYAPIGPDQARYTINATSLETRGNRRDVRVGVLFGSPDLLATLGVGLARGRSLGAADARAQPAPVVVTASLARKLWPDASALGETLSLGPRRSRYFVVGVVQDFVYGSLTQDSDGAVIAVKPDFGIEAPFVIRTSAPDSLIEPIRKTVRSIVPEAPRVVVSTGRDIITRDLGRQRLGAWFFSGFGLVALLLGAGGVFGLVAYLAESRRREFGVRLALGATARDLVWRGMAGGLTPVSIGTATGLLGAAVTARLFVSLLPGLSTLDPLTYAGAGAFVIGVAAITSFAGAWRLRRVMPSEAMRAT